MIIKFKNFLNILTELIKITRPYTLMYSMYLMYLMYSVFGGRQDWCPKEHYIDYMVLSWLLLEIVYRSEAAKYFLHLSIMSVLNMC